LELATIDDVRRAILPLMRSFPATWCVAGGWAIDLLLRRVTRPHGDIELAIFREDQRLLHRQLRGWHFEKIVDGQRVEWPEGERLELPVHEIHARRIDGPNAVVEFLLNERDGDEWVYRRNSAIRLPVERAIIHSSEGLPMLAPEIVLLFKSKSPRAKDAADLAATLPALNSRQRGWLSRAIAAAGREHPWLTAINAASGGHA
jgi:hypothetical protein